MAVALAGPREAMSDGEGAARGDEVAIERDGRRYTGLYRVRDDMVTVTGEHRSRSVRLCGSAPDVLARMMLRELVQRSRTR